MDDLRTVFHLPINDAAKKVRKKKHALVILVRRNKQQQQEQKTKEFFFALGFLGALIWVPHLLCLFFLLGDGFGFSLKTHHLMIVLCLSNIPVGLMRDGS